ncbi:MAG: STAS domain-containing protein [Gammaproteobacteria bacterium]|nr:MAG: STAS domain-containing protein [Gammaproteobacteria bacterium]
MIMKQADVTLQNNQILVSGDIDFSNVMSVYEKSLPLLSAAAEPRIDFSQVTSSDSSGLALVIEWIKLAGQQQKRIHIIHLSDDLMSIAKAARVGHLISL